MGRPLLTPTFVLGLLGLSAALLGCVDLLHNTDEMVGLCERSSGRSTCEGDAGSVVDARDAGKSDAEAGGRLCRDVAYESEALAVSVCARLGTYASPMGQNQLGSCVRRARAAYHCSAEPGRAPLGPRAAFWSCMASAVTEADVLACLFPNGPEVCGAASFASCGAGTPTTRVWCESSGGAPVGEPCVAWGQTCSLASGVRCASNGEGSCVATPTCHGNELRHCDGSSGADLGADCSMVGAAACVEREAGATCAPVGSTTCIPQARVTCEGDTAISCLSGIEERVDCALLTGRAGTCIEGPLPVPHDPSSACRIEAPCPPDRCEGSRLHSCHLGVPVEVDCAALGLSGCEVTFVDGVGPRGRCTASDKQP